MSESVDPQPQSHASRRDQGQDQCTIAFFSMEVALDDAVPTFSGGLGVLAGDYLRSAADLALSVVGVTLLYRKGYFLQHLDSNGRQTETPVKWAPEELLRELPQRVTIEIEGRRVTVGARVLEVRGCSGSEVPLYLLDTDLPENDREDRRITDQLYAGDKRHRLLQECVLGIGGAALLESLGLEPVIFHMNEGHCALLTISVLESHMADGEVTDESIAAVRDKCVFTTHTPVPAGHDRFDASLVTSVLGKTRSDIISEVGCLSDRTLNMTELGLRFSGYVNAVSLRHREVSQQMFPDTPIRSITNGVHVASWVATPVRRLFDHHLPGWPRNYSLLHYASCIPLEELAEAHAQCKRGLFDTVRHATGTVLDPDALTIGLARRATPYKRTTLLFSDPDRLRTISDTIGPVQVVCSGKAHPRDEAGKKLIEQILESAKTLRGSVEVVFLEGYDLHLGSLLCSGSDIWLNTPAKPHEASGTSGMKAAVNGVPSLSVLDGWWVEGCIERVTGWAVGDLSSGSDDASSLYDKLANAVVPLFYDDQDGFRTVMRNAISLNGSFFNTERMVREYVISAYRMAV